MGNQINCQVVARSVMNPDELDEPINRFMTDIDFRAGNRHWSAACRVWDLPQQLGLLTDLSRSCLCAETTLTIRVTYVQDVKEQRRQFQDQLRHCHQGCTAAATPGFYIVVMVLWVDVRHATLLIFDHRSRRERHQWFYDTAELRNPNLSEHMRKVEALFDGYVRRAWYYVYVPRPTTSNHM